ncbi:flavin reductase family protein [Fictibacillus aquaticus]|uniref:Flavin reductase like domain-containing protein n=1 Tax=Fictibacillus aquaticus TaxID=2021314 RepID=A0A235FE29_9BACL|nr:flavin reductase family protein [Fictibacillus aquaticus]OYD59571.1 hypothetical protein CGZ90_06685 [Fictibacillus aquaticus]
MKAVDPNSLDVKGNYKFLTGSVIPRPIAFVTSETETGVLNAAPFSYFNVITADPPLISISVGRKNGEMKDTARNIFHKKEFVVHIPDESYIEAVNVTAASLPPDESEVELAGLTTVESTSIHVPGIKEASIRMECVLEQIIPLGGTADNPAADLIIGQVVQYHIKEELYDNGRIDAEALKPVGRLAGNDYVKLGETFAIKRPE